MLTSDTPYSLENFKWLMENSSANSYLGDDTLKNIASALKSGNEEYLEQIYPIILETYIKNRDTDDKFRQNQYQMIDSLTTKINEAEKQEKEGTKIRKKLVEKREKEDADNILNKLNF